MSLEKNRINPRVSICLATYNGANCIEEQIQSVICQLNEFDEVVVSDDRSTDNTLEIIKSFQDSRIKIYTNRFSSGPVGNFQNAMSHVSGDIIFLCDQDDIWKENKIDRHLEMHKDHDLVISNAIVIDENHNVLFSSFFEARGSKQGLFTNLLKNSYIGCCMSFNKTVLDASLPFPPGIHMHDWWIGLVAELKGKIYFIKEPLMFYIRHNSNASDTLIKTLPFKEQLKNRAVLVRSLIPLLFK